MSLAKMSLISCHSAWTRTKMMPCWYLSWAGQQQKTCWQHCHSRRCTGRCLLLLLLLSLPPAGSGAAGLLWVVACCCMAAGPQLLEVQPEQQQMMMKLKR
jgi:hypothetical protein